jgi:hypothetical protein
MCMQAQALGRLADVTIIDRDTGNALPTYLHRGEYWVAGAPGARYAIQIRNQLGGRLLAVTAVDGVNVVSGETASWGQTGYVYGPGQAYQITGWRKSSDEVAAFEFTAAPNSYAARTGRAANIGVIGVALFRERAPAIVSMPAPYEDQADAAGAAGAANTQRATSEAPAARQASPSAPDRRGDLSANLERFALRQQLGTGHGQREGSHVDNVDFERLQDSPNEIVRIRYDSTENLIAMGVIRRPPRQGIVPNPFPDSPLARYVPDPPGMQ